MHHITGNAAQSRLGLGDVQCFHFGDPNSRLKEGNILLAGGPWLDP